MQGHGGLMLLPTPSVKQSPRPSVLMKPSLIDFVHTGTTEHPVDLFMPLFRSQGYGGCLTMLGTWKKQSALAVFFFGFIQ